MSLTIGVIVNPIAGMGGKVALKGTDGQSVLEEAIALGAVPEAPDKARRALRSLCSGAGDYEILTCSGAMGEQEIKALGLPCKVVYGTPARTGPEDTRRAAARMAEEQPDLLVFAGGDGTARNIFEAVGERVPVLGIPAGVKIQSAVFALSPEAAGDILRTLTEEGRLRTVLREVVDLDEDAYRTGKVHARIYGQMRTPAVSIGMQNMKQSGFTSEQLDLAGAAEYICEHMKAGEYYAVGAGSGAKAVLHALDISGELLGVDVINDGKLIASDVTEEELFSYALTGKLHVIVTPIGGQGFIFGRGNHQFSARVLRHAGRERITIISPLSKLLSIGDGVFHADLADADVREMLSGYYNVVCGYGYFVSFRCV